jgi:hypothetical protein
MAVENFDSLRDDLQSALKRKYGKETWLDEFSTDHAIFSKHGEKTQRSIPYSIEKGGVKFTGKHFPVRRVSGYERVNKAAHEKAETPKASVAPRGEISD